MNDDRIVGYTVGCYDMFHIGHLNIIKRSKELCDYLVVGVNTDELMSSYKSHSPIVPEEERLEIIKSLRQVDDAMLIDSLDHKLTFPIIKYKKIFIGDDHRSDDRWIALEKYLRQRGAEVVYLPYTKNTSSTILRDKLASIN